jgi:lysophospholipase L1-like esterase
MLGDSIAFGQGAARPDDRLADRLARGLEKHGHAVEAEVWAVPGARSADLDAQVDRALAATSTPTVAVVVIGANDLTHLVPAAQAADQLEAAVRRLREAGVEVVLAPAPDLSAVPWVPPELRPAVQSASDRLRGLQAAVVRRHGGRMADADHATSTAFAADPALFSADRFHPSSAGYAVIADALLPAVLEAAESAS